MVWPAFSCLASGWWSCRALPSSRPLSCRCWRTTPLLAIDAPTFAEGFLGVFTGSAGGTNFGTLATIWTLLGPMCILGPLLFGIATFRAGILSRWAAGVFGFGSVSSLAFALIPPALEPLATVPVGIGLAWLGYALWSERREHASDPVPGRGRPQLRQAGAE